jgi:acyl-CoA thioesterase
VASACHIDFLAPARKATLDAEAVERPSPAAPASTTSPCATASGKTIALFRGKSYRINGEVIAGPQQAD